MSADQNRITFRGREVKQLKSAQGADDLQLAGSPEASWKTPTLPLLTFCMWKWL